MKKEMKEDMDNTRSKKEYWNLYDFNHQFYGVHERGNPLPENVYYDIVSIFIFNEDSKLLITRRAEAKTYAGLWEVTAGAVMANEPLDLAVLRELKEETGLICPKDQLHYLDSVLYKKENIRIHCYCAKIPFQLEDIQLQEGETDRAQLVDFDLDCLITKVQFAEPVIRRLMMFWRDLIEFIKPEESNHDLDSFLWLNCAKELQSISQQGIQYTKDPYDKERFQRISEIACEILAHKTSMTRKKVVELFANETGYQTPKIETRAVVLNEKDEVLLVHETNGNEWSLPGGWCDIGLGIGENTKKECLEEAGCIVEPKRLLMVHNRSSHDYSPYPYEIIKCFIECKLEKISFHENIETDKIGFFSMEKLPKLSKERITETVLKELMRLVKNPQIPTQFD